MKTKLDFVTNSSSSSFIVCIPEQFDVESFVLENFDWKEFYSEYTGNKNTKEEVIEFVKKLIEKGGMHEQEEEWTSEVNAWDLLEMFEKQKLVLHEVEKGQDGAGGLEIIHTDELFNKIEDIEKRFFKNK